MINLQSFEKVPTKELNERFLEEARGLEERDQVRLHRRLFSDSLTDLWDEMSHGMTGFNGYKMLRLSLLFDPQDNLPDIEQAHKTLVAFKAWDRIEKALSEARKYLSGPFVKWALLIADRTRPEVLEKFKGTVGFGNIPPFILLGIWPTKYSLVHLTANVSREYHHVMRSSLFPVQAVRYPLSNSLVAEGLAECYIEEVFGEQFVSDTARSLDIAEVKKLWPKFNKNIKLNGIDQHRSFMYGGYRTNLPYCAGFSVGYRVVKSFLDNSGVKSNEAIMLPAKKIFAGSDFKIKE